MSAPASRGAAVGGGPMALMVLLLVLATGPLRPAQGSCLSYGHSCWGAHGKRSGGVVGGGALTAGGGAGGGRAANVPTDTRWVLSRLAMPPAQQPADDVGAWQPVDARALRAAAAAADAAEAVAEAAEAAEAGDETAALAAARAALLGAGVDLSALAAEEVIDMNPAVQAAAAAEEEEVDAERASEGDAGAVLLLGDGMRHPSRPHPLPYPLARPRPLPRAMRLSDFLENKPARKLD